ncbi:hypothetical protein EDD85DRAFT_496799 [Armillaria nabsnona]|nr:hypothetical protein EDD85DRAFT_496799 [Armillaria nabsnona]
MIPLHSAKLYADGNCCLFQSSSSIRQLRILFGLSLGLVSWLSKLPSESFLSRIDLSLRAPPTWFALSIFSGLAHYTLVSSLIDSWCKTSKKATLSPHRRPLPRHVQSTKPSTPPSSEYSPGQDLTYRNTIFPWDFLINGYEGVGYRSRLLMGDVLWTWMSEGECLKRHTHPNLFFPTSQASPLSTESPLNLSSGSALLDLAVLSLSSIAPRLRLPFRPFLFPFIRDLLLLQAIRRPL